MKYTTEVCSEPNRTSNMELFAITVAGFYPLTIVIKNSILDVQLGSEYASALLFKITSSLMSSVSFKLISKCKNS